MVTVSPKNGPSGPGEYSSHFMIRLCPRLVKKRISPLVSKRGSKGRLRDVNIDCDRGCKASGSQVDVECHGARAAAAGCPRTGGDRYQR